MGQQLFAGSLVETRPRAAAAVPVSMAVHVMVVGGLLALPLIAGGDPPPVPAQAPVFDTIVFTMPPPPVAHPVYPRPEPQLPRRASELPAVVAPATRPVPLWPDPPAPSTVVDESDACVGCALTTGTGSGGTGEPGIVAGGGDPDGRGTGSTPLVVGGRVSAPAKLRHVDPEYPDLARRAGVQGTVEIECVIDSSGRVASARVLRGVPLLDTAALAAVQRWTYRPTLLNGVAVPVVMTVTVQFHLR